MSAVLNLSLGEFKARLDEFDEHVRVDFHLPALSAEPLDADEDHILTDEPDAKRTEQIVTHLQLLGYLPNREHFSRDEIDDRLARWEEDFRVARSRETLEIALEGENLENVPWAEARLRYLKALATFEGEVALRAFPPDESVCLESRLIHLRLIAYGLSRAIDRNTTAPADVFGAGAPFSARTTTALAVGAGIFFAQPTQPLLDVVNLLGNAPAATDAFLTHHGKLRFLFKGDPVSTNDSIHRWGFDQPPAWTPRWQQTGSFWRPGTSVAPASLPILVDTGNNAPMDEQHLAAQARLPLNVVGLELLQLRLWTLGYYHGAIDGTWGALTEEALDDFGQAHANLDNKGDYIRVGRNGWRAVNLLRIFGTIVEDFDLPAERLSGDRMNQIAEGAVNALGDDDWRKLDENYRAYRAKERAVLAAPQVDASGFSIATRDPQRKRYFGWRRFFAAVGIFLRRARDVVQAAISKIIEALRRGVSHAFEILRFLWRKVRIAVRIARLAARRLYCWLTGSPVGTVIDTHCAVTWWGLDFDSIVLASSECPQRVLDHHHGRLDWMSRSLVFMGELALFVVAAVARTAIGSWLALAYSVFKLVREMITNPEYRAVFSDDVLERGTI